jgi:hypothetical protein
LVERCFRRLRLLPELHPTKIPFLLYKARVYAKYEYNSVENTMTLKYKYTFSGTQIHRKYEYNSVQTLAKLSTLLTSILILKIEKKSLSKPINIGLGSSFEDLDAKSSKIKNSW